jgi:hypothetical protein
MTCDAVRKLIPLYFYGELSPEEEDQAEAHVHECAPCAGELERQRTLAAALDRRSIIIPPALLEDCRADLMAAIQGGAPSREKPSKDPWTLFLEAVAQSFAGLGRMRQPLAAALLIAIGFLIARYTNGRIAMPAGSSGNAPVTTASLPSDVFFTVRSVQPDSTGRVNMVVDETRRREVSGNTEDQNIQKLLLAAAHEDNPAVRVESVDLLKDQAASSEVRDALLNALAHDTNAGVRLKALQGLKPVAADPEVRKTLAQVLLNDDNDAVRMQAVDLLIAHPDGSMVGVLQNVVQREENTYVRQKIEKTLKEMNASVGTF